VLCKDGRREFPDHDLAAWIEQHQPDIVICGHIHQAPWVQGWLVARAARPDVGVQRRQADRARPADTSRFDTDARTAHWYGVFDSETIDLG
jgi:hypothetical protein